MSEENKAVVRRYFELWNAHEVDALGEVLAADAVDHDPYNPHGQEGVEGQKRTIQMYLDAFPDTHFEIEQMVAEGDMVATRWTATGTHQGELMGIPPTGNRARVSGIAIDRIENGKIAEGWNSWDVLGMMQNLGAIPEPEPAAAQA